MLASSEAISSEMTSAYKLLSGAMCTVGLVGAAIGSGVIFGCFLLAVSRNPSQKGTLLGLALLGFAMTEAIGLFSLMMCFYFLYV